MSSMNERAKTMCYSEGKSHHRVSSDIRSNVISAQLSRKSLSTSHSSGTLNGQKIHRNANQPPALSYQRTQFLNFTSNEKTVTDQPTRTESEISLTQPESSNFDPEQLVFLEELRSRKDTAMDDIERLDEEIQRLAEHDSACLENDSGHDGRQLSFRITSKYSEPEKSSLEYSQEPTAKTKRPERSKRSASSTNFNAQSSSVKTSDLKSLPKTAVAEREKIQLINEIISSTTDLAGQLTQDHADQIDLTREWLVGMKNQLYAELQEKNFNDRSEYLFERAMIQKQMRELAHLTMKEKKERDSVNECTFKPSLSPNRRNIAKRSAGEGIISRTQAWVQTKGERQTENEIKKILKELESCTFYPNNALETKNLDDFDPEAFYRRNIEWHKQRETTKKACQDEILKQLRSKKKKVEPYSPSKRCRSSEAVRYSHSVGKTNKELLLQIDDEKKVVRTEQSTSPSESFGKRHTAATKSDSGKKRDQLRFSLNFGSPLNKTATTAADVFSRLTSPSTNQRKEPCSKIRNFKELVKHSQTKTPVSNKAHGTPSNHQRVQSTNMKPWKDLKSEIISPIKTEISESLEIIEHLTDAIKSQKRLEKSGSNQQNPQTQEPLLTNQSRPNENILPLKSDEFSQIIAKLNNSECMVPQEHLQEKKVDVENLSSLKEIPIASLLEGQKYLSPKSKLNIFVNKNRYFARNYAQMSPSSTNEGKEGVRNKVIVPRLNLSKEFLLKSFEK